MIPENSWKNGRITIRSSSVLWDKKFFMRSRDNTTPLLSMRIFDTRSFLKSGRVTLRSFSVLWDNNSFDGKSRYSNLPSSLPWPSYSKKTPTPKTFQNCEGFVYDVFGTVTKTISKENRNTPPLSVTFLESRKFLNHRRVPPRNLSVLWDKKFLTGSRDNPSPSFIHKLFRYPKFSEIRKVSLRTLLLLWGKTIQTKNRDTPSLISNFCR